MPFHYKLITDETQKDTDISGGSVFDHLIYCDLRDSNDCKHKTDGIFDTCQRVKDTNGNSKTIGVCVPRRLGCDSDLHCNTIGSTSGERSLIGECVTGLCHYQLY